MKWSDNEQASLFNNFESNTITQFKLVQYLPMECNTVLSPKSNND
jgi:hypothetical protein